jgi:hypothetical protein
MSSTHSLRPHDLVVLQRSAGNQAVSRLLQIDIAPDSPMATPDDVAVSKSATPPGRVERLLDRVRVVTRWPRRWSVD